MKPKTRFEKTREALWDAGWELFQTRRRGSRYTARPAHCAIFELEQPSWGFFDLTDVERFVQTCTRQIASRVDYDWIRTKRALRYPLNPS
jgi:hypothetical protein